MLKKVTRVSLLLSALSMHYGYAADPILGHVMNQDHMFHKTSEKFMEKLDELSNNTMKIAYHPGGDLGDYTTIVEQVAQGSVQMTTTWQHSELEPRWDVTVLGYLADDWESAKTVYGPGSMMEGIYNDILSDIGIELLGTIPTDFTGFVMRKGADEVPVNFPEDAKGVKIRVPLWPMSIELYEEAGFSVIPMAMSEIYTALQTGTIDARAYSPPSEVILFGDAISTYVFTRENFEHAFFIANAAWLNSLSEEQQSWVREAATYATSWAWDNAEKDSDMWMQKIRDQGIKIVELSPEQLAKFKEIVYKVEFPYMEKLLGKETVDKIRAVAGK